MEVDYGEIVLALVLLAVFYKFHKCKATTGRRIDSLLREVKEIKKQLSL